MTESVGMKDIDFVFDFFIISFSSLMLGKCRHKLKGWYRIVIILSCFLVLTHFSCHYVKIHIFLFGVVFDEKNFLLSSGTT